MKTQKSCIIFYFYVVVALTGLWTLAELVHEGWWMLDDVEDGQQGAREAQQLAEAVKTKVNHLSSQIHHLMERKET